MSRVHVYPADENHNTGGPDCPCSPRHAMICPECGAEHADSEVRAMCFRCGGEGVIDATLPHESEIVVHRRRRDG